MTRKDIMKIGVNALMELPDKSRESLALLFEFALIIQGGKRPEVETEPKAEKAS